MTEYMLSQTLGLETFQHSIELSHLGRPLRLWPLEEVPLKGLLGKELLGKELLGKILEDIPSAMSMSGGPPWHRHLF